MRMPRLSDIVAYCDERIRLREVKDFDGAYNGLQIENNGIVTKIGAAVDAGQVPLRRRLPRALISSSATTDYSGPNPSP